MASKAFGWLGLLAGVTFFAAETAAQDRPDLAMTVVVRGHDVVPAGELQQSMAVVSAIYRRIGVEIVWVHPDGFAAAMPTDTEERIRFCRRVLLVNLTPGEPIDHARNARVLGAAAPGTRLAHAFVERVRNEATRRRVHFADLLGHVIAHEIGHLLLPPSSHSPMGLMRASLDLIAVGQHRLSFDAAQAAIIRAKVAAELMNAGLSR